MASIFDYSLLELETYLIEMGDKKYRASQIFEWLYRNRVNHFSEMTNISLKLIEHLSTHFIINKLEIVTIKVSSDGTRKYLFKLNDGQLIETVLMKHNYGNSLCVTSQVGCNMGCTFCASGELGKVRNLTLAEMVLQIVTVQKELDLTYERITNIVVMGIGEPFDNYETVIKFLEVANYAKGLEIGARHMTVSTCGIVPKIRAFADFPLQVNLAISLHAPNNELRSKIMKINKVYPIEDIIDALKEYIVKTSRRITFEYILLKGVNDSVQCANQLADLIRGMNAYVNLIPYNKIDTKEYNQTDQLQAGLFFKTLTARKIQATIRKEHGGDISAACGQLRNKIVEQNDIKK